MIYLGTPYEKIPEKWRHKFGVMCSLAGRIEWTGLKDGRKWMLDNGQFTGKFKEQKWIDTMKKLTPYADNCLGIVVPDFVGDAVETLKMWREYNGMVLDCYPKAFVGQDGLTDELIPWPEFDVLFIGGTDKFKLTESHPWIVEANERGKWTHVGRVNSTKRIESFWYADSVDGTYIKFGHGVLKSYQLMKAVEHANSKKQTRRLL